MRGLRNTLLVKASSKNAFARSFPMSLTRDEIRYGLRLAWVHAKDAVGLPRRGDRTFYVEQLVRKLRSGELGRNIRITAAGKTDGAGAQAQAIISGIVFASAFGLDYLHSPFRSIEHAEGPMDEWVSAWETTFNFGAGHQLLEASGLPVMPLGDFLKHRSLWREDFAVVMPHYLHWCNRNTAAYETVLPLIRRNYYRDGAPRLSPDLVIGVHLRRGDVSATKVAGAYTPNHWSPPPCAASSNFCRIEASLSRSGFFRRGRPRISVNSPRLGPSSISTGWHFGPFANSSKPMFSSWRRVRSAMWRASFATGSRLYEPYHERPLPHWLARDEDGGFDEIELCRQLNLVLEVKCGGAEQGP